MFNEPTSLLPFPGGLRVSPDDLRPVVDLALAGGAPGPETAGVLVHLQGEKKGFSWLARMAEVEPALAVQATLQASALSLTYRPEYKVCLIQRQPSPIPFEVFSALRKGFDTVGGRDAVSLPDVNDLALRAGLAWVFPERPLWSDEDLRKTFSDTPLPHFLAAAIRHRPELWGRPITEADGVTDEVLVLAGEPQAVARFRERRTFATEAEQFEKLVAERFREALCLAASPGRKHALQQILERPEPKTNDLAPWLRALASVWQPGQPLLPAAPWTSPFSGKKGRPSLPPAPPVLEGGGRWARAHSIRENFTEQDIDPAFIGSTLEKEGVVALPLARRLTLERPNLLADLGHVDDVGLGISWVAAMSKPVSSRGPDVTSWLRANPEVSVPAVVLAFFERDPGVHRGARQALEILERSHPALVERTFATLSAEQRAHVNGLRAPPPLGKPVKLPAFVDVATLPRLLHRSGQSEFSDTARLELAMMLKLTPLHDNASLLALTSEFDEASLRGFAGGLALAWLRAGGASKERWAVDALAHFGDDAWAKALGALAERLIPEWYAEAQTLIGTLAALPSRNSIGVLLRLSKSRTASIRKTASSAMEQCAAMLGLTAAELADQVVPDTAPDGFEFGKKAPSSASATTKAEWKAATSVSKDAIARAQALMVRGTSMSVQSFLETWLLKPLLKQLADHIIWGVYRKEERVGLRCGSFSHGVSVPSPEMRIRPVHPLELDKDQLVLVTTWVKPKDQPFPQLARSRYGLEDVHALAQFVGRPLTRALLTDLEGRGWQLSRTTMTIERRGVGWHLCVRMNFVPTGSFDDEGSMVTAIDFAKPESVAPAILSELQHDLHDVLG